MYSRREPCQPIESPERKKIRNYESCIRLIDFYHSYTERKDQKFKLLSEANKEVRFSKHDSDVMIFDDAFDPREKGYGRWLSEVKNPVQWLKSLQVVQIITVVANGKACST